MEYSTASNLEITRIVDIFVRDYVLHGRVSYHMKSEENEIYKKIVFQPQKDMT